MALKSIAAGILFIALFVVAFGDMEADNAGFTDKDLQSEETMWDLYEKWLFQNGNPRNDLREKLRRFDIFKDNVMYIQRVNLKKASYKLRLNKFSDLTNEEFRATYTGASKLGRRTKLGNTRDFMYGNASLNDLPVSVDWREKGAVTAVKNQGSCGSCWAFSTVAAVEGINQIVSKRLVSLSEQVLVDCDTKINTGCNGGLMDYAFQFIIENGGISAERDYPYTAEDGQCDVKRKNSHAVVIDGYEDVPVNSDEALTKAVAHQPVSVAIEAGGPDFQFYWQGVFTGECSTGLDHGVAVVGYGVSSEGIKYWIVKNSWGADWGEDGYIRVQRGIEKPEGLCGINMEASYPVKTTPNPSALSGRINIPSDRLLNDATSLGRLLSEGKSGHRYATL